MNSRPRLRPITLPSPVRYRIAKSHSTSQDAQNRRLKPWCSLSIPFALPVQNAETIQGSSSPVSGNHSRRIFKSVSDFQPLQSVVNIRLGLPIPEGMVEVGAFVLRTDRN